MLNYTNIKELEEITQPPLRVAFMVIWKVFNLPQKYDYTQKFCDKILRCKKILTFSHVHVENPTREQWHFQKNIHPKS